MLGLELNSAITCLVRGHHEHEVMPQTRFLERNRKWTSP
jgi:hypothetical protein